MNETWDQSEQKIREYISTELELDETEIKIERIDYLEDLNHGQSLSNFPFIRTEKILTAYRERVSS